MPPKVPEDQRSVSVGFRLPRDVFDMLPPASLTGERTAYVLDAIRRQHAATKAEESA